MSRSIANRDYQSKKNKGNIVGYKVALSKNGVNNISHIDEKDELNIEYKENMIIIMKKIKNSPKP